MLDDTLRKADIFLNKKSISNWERSLVEYFKALVSKDYNIMTSSLEDVCKYYKQTKDKYSFPQFDKLICSHAIGLYMFAKLILKEEFIKIELPKTNIFNVIPTDLKQEINKEDRRTAEKDDTVADIRASLAQSIREGKTIKREIDPLYGNKCSLLGYILPTNPLKYIIKDNEEMTSEDKILYSFNKINIGSPDTIFLYQKHFITIKEKYIPELIQILKYDSSLCEIVKWVENIFSNHIDYNLPNEILLGCWEASHLYFYRISITGRWRDLNTKPLTQEPYSLKLDIFSRNTGILESDIMLTKGAVFIGCGSVGSLFALELARAGVGRFMLIDSDILGYHNICRHQCGIFDVGRYKTDAVRDKILQINPYAEVVTYNMRIQEVPLDDLMSFCDINTIVIGGADNREGDLYANGIAQHVGMPFMSIGCWERAFAGEIFYCLPTGMPTYKDFMEVAGHMSARVNQNRRF